MTPKDPFLEGTFWDKFWRPIRSRALLFIPESSCWENFGSGQEVGPGWDQHGARMAPTSSPGRPRKTL